MRHVQGRFLIALLLNAAFASQASDRLAISDVTLIDVEDGSARTARTVLIEDGRIVAIGDSRSLRPPEGSVVVDGRGRFLLPGFWDMHVHSHREGRWKYHYPLFLAYGVTGVRDAGAHLSSAIVAMEDSRRDPLAPTIVWGSPPFDGPNPVLPFGLGIESGAAAAPAVALVKRLGFDFVKTYDRLSPGAYRALAAAADRDGLRIEGHVPLAMSPLEVVAAGHDLIDHLTLVIESCAPGALEHLHDKVAAAPDEADSMLLMADPGLERLMSGFDREACRKLFATFAERGVRQVPTLVQARGYFLPEESRRLTEARIPETTPPLLADWDAMAKEGDPRELAAGAALYRRQLAAMRDLQDAGVPLMTGTDVSSEAWVFAGSSVHDEMALLVEGGLGPLEALQAATLQPLRYVGRAKAARVIDVGEIADLVLLDADPRQDIAQTRAIHAVIQRGRLFDLAALEALKVRGRAEASKGGT